MIYIFFVFITKDGKNAVKHEEFDGKMSANTDK